jgi:phytoene synthase
MVMTANPAAAAAPAFAAARAICRRHSKGLFFTSAFLPVRKRNAAYAVYTFCQMIEEAIAAPPASPPAAPATLAPSCGSPGSIEQTLARFRARLDDIYADRLDLPPAAQRDERQHALYAFGQSVERYQIPQQFFLDLAEGRRIDLTTTRYATWRALQNYCDHTGGPAALAMSCVLGLSHSDARQHVLQISTALQLTRILRDIKPDLARGRIYLPLEDLARFKVAQRDLAAGAVTPSIRQLMQFEIARARDLYRQGAQGICWVAGDGSRLTASAIAVIYSGLLTQIERQGYDVFSHQPRLTAAQKLRRMSGAWRLARRRHGQLLPDVFK